ncbi:YeeE/YedE family protein [Bradyrhizobium jicamae]|uniref:YeeE/YedE family protein n=1 Tax=Bradyrhizobium jicamae TaxID=280332 RepID=UPI001BA98579|nr:YeeE/YedE family protein [Bradyrhizobium jicamae]MBR0753000.1 YeeE/YedE family protein [Bradyrhizobium jicamae]
MSTTFEPITAVIGGVLIGFSAVMLMAISGRIAGVSGIAARLLPPVIDRDWPGRLAFLAGLVAAPLLWRLANGEWPPQTIATDGTMLAVAGVLVGFGSVWGNGCTSGHGVCGISRLSVRSIVATLAFMVTGVATTFVVRHLL